jgi:hypothetical protein
MPEAPSLEDQPINDDAPDAPELSDQPSGDEDSLPEFDYSGIPDDQRESVEGRIKGFQAKFTQAQQGLAEARRDAEQAQQVVTALRNPQTAPDVLRQLGYSPEQVVQMMGYQLPEDEDDELDLDEVHDPRVDALLQEREQEKAQDRLLDDFAGHVEGIEQAEKRELSPGEQKILWRNVQGDLATNGTANVQEIWAELKAEYSDREKALLDPKRNTPRPPGGGKPGSRTVDLSKESDEDFVRRMANAVDEARASAQ